MGFRRRRRPGLFLRQRCYFMARDRFSWLLIAYPIRRTELNVYYGCA